MNHGRTINLHFKVLLGIIALIGLLILKASFVKAGNDFIAVDLRTDIPFIPNFHDYQVLLASEGGPTGANENNFTTAWLSLNLDDEPGLYGHQFIQVGLIAFNDGLHWFVYAEPGVTCLFGEESYWNDDLNKYLGCLGEVGEFVDFGRFFKVELATYSTEDFWTARVEDEQGTVHNVAFIWSTSKNIYDADVSMEEGYTTVIDPFEYGLFHMWHPQYHSGAEGFKEWPSSDSSINLLYAVPEDICPIHYGAWTYVYNDPRYWKAGSGGFVCHAEMFPPIKIFLPAILR